ncbi:WYL domain-containing protein [Neobacillus sp. OS1-33]|uniref:helix-turn-helix transcriptional regulator n=1 Tax=Neobacillus sp. OS1-33 TaxID=3070683 RepID=UPI0027E1098E|nr:WYL domain-containing protein [Neobacillus sp. OS1-33]WML26318.1 WYL domain-containing protein [Neobacillus sp. OS1-33]
MKHGSNTQKITVKDRIIRLQELLKKFTDEDNGLTVKQIVDKFYDEYNVDVGIKAIRDDLRELEESRLFDVTVNQEKDGLEKYYSHQHRLFEIYELRMLIDAVSSAKFISKTETENLIRKIENLTSYNQAKKLENRILISESVKSEDHKIKYTIHELHTAISNSQIITCKYGKYNLDKKFQFNRNGEFYKVKPYALVWNSDYYYLIGEYLPNEEIRHYRVDRMRDVTACQEVFVRNPEFNVTKYIGKLFHMYSGEESLIEIEFDAQLINVVIDRFGRDLTIRPIGENAFRISTQAIISDGLVRWLLTWGSNAKVLTPSFLVGRMREESEKLYQKYH